MDQAQYHNRCRQRNQESNSLVISNISDEVIAAPNVVYHHIFLLPIEGGYFTLAPAGSGVEDALQQDEILVVDTIDQYALGPGYIAKNLKTPADSIGTRRMLLATPDVSLYGTGFKIEPNQPGLFMFLFADHTTTGSDKPFGSFVSTKKMKVDFEIMPRFLYM